MLPKGAYCCIHLLKSLLPCSGQEESTAHHGNEEAVNCLCYYKNYRDAGHHDLPQDTKDTLQKRLDPNFGERERKSVHALLYSPGGRCLFLCVSHSLLLGWMEKWTDFAGIRYLFVCPYDVWMDGHSDRLTWDGYLYLCRGKDSLSMLCCTVKHLVFARPPSCKYSRDFIFENFPVLLYNPYIKKF